MSRRALPEDVARSLLDVIDEWCARTGTRETHIGHVLFLHPGFVGLLRKRLTLSAEKAAAAREFMAAHSDGWRGELPVTHGGVAKPRRSAPIMVRGPLPVTKLTDEQIAARRVDRDACSYCGVRADIGCKHARAFG